MLDLDVNFTNHIIDGIENVLPRIPSALFDLLVGIIIIRLMKRLIKVLMKAFHVQPGLRGVILSIIEIVMWVFLLIAVLNVLGFSGVIYFFTGSIAALGLAMAAGGSTLISDIIAGLFLAQDKDFNVGDEVAVMNDRPVVGRIESMDARRTRIRDNQGVLHIIPNSIVERKEWILIRRRREVTALAKATKAAQKFSKAALKKQVSMRRRRAVSNNDQ